MRRPSFLASSLLSLTQFSAAAGAQQRQSLPPSDRLQLRELATADQVGAVDVTQGKITGVSLLTADREASGHGVWIDQRTLETFKEQLDGRRIKAYATHGSWGGDGTLDEVGFWEAPRIDGKQLREDFTALDAWRKHEEAEFDTLFELATKLPQEFGASLSFRMKLAWITKSGAEIETVRKWRQAGWDYEQYFDPAMPADAVRPMPSVRCVEVYSADFVCVPAANDGLFRAGPVDGRGNGASEKSELSMNKELFAKFGSNPALLAQAMKLHTENEKLTFAEIVAKVEGDQLSAELNNLRAEVVSFKAKAGQHDASVAALKAAGFEDKDGKSAVELALAALTKANADIAAFKAGGSPAVDTGAKGAESSANSKTKTRAEFLAMNPADRLKFSKEGGKVVDAASN